jgi:hypothetical protein
MEEILTRVLFLIHQTLRVAFFLVFVCLVCFVKLTKSTSTIRVMFESNISVVCVKCFTLENSQDTVIRRSTKVVDENHHRRQAQDQSRMDHLW